VRLERRVALVTGGNRGIGEQIVRLFAGEGAHVAFCARRADLGKRVEEAVRDGGGEATYFQCDVAGEEQVEKLIDNVINAYGQLDIVVNNAGIAPASPVEEMETSVWRDVMDCNVTSMFLVSKHSIPHLKRTKGTIINLGSTFGVIGAAGSSAYAVSKAAAISLARSMALELAADGVRVNALCPGGTDTEFLHEWFESTGDYDGTRTWLLERHPFGRFGQPEEIARAVLFLASEDASFVTGHALLVDGGYTAQ
jgi:NAD(P)-dependent dehydrogenase (short-subunit alcohol dehydrogenase family)